MRVRPDLLALTLAGILAATVAWAAGSGPEQHAAVVTYKDTPWEDLIPKGWDPLKRFREANIAALNDGSPKVMDMMREMREAWDNAPTNSAMEGAVVRMPGYVVPLEEAKGELKEFLLVPYFGACIHTPPPPANQIIDVLVDKPVKGVRTMDAVWVSGTLSTFRQESVMGMSGYRMRAALVVPYTAPVARP